MSTGLDKENRRLNLVRREMGRTGDEKREMGKTGTNLSEDGRQETADHNSRKLIIAVTVCTKLGGARSSQFNSSETCVIRFRAHAIIIVQLQPRVSRGVWNWAVN